jgi:hypothetical protein
MAEWKCSGNSASAPGCAKHEVRFNVVLEVQRQEPRPLTFNEFVCGFLFPIAAIALIATLIYDFDKRYFPEERRAARSGSEHVGKD